MQRKEEALKAIESVVKDRAMAEAVLERLQDDAFLHLGYGKAEVDQILGAFQEKFGSTKITKYDRTAANRLANVHTVKMVLAAINMLSSLSNEKYAPTVGSVQQLEDKWVNVVSFLRKQQQQGEVVQL